MKQTSRYNIINMLHGILFTSIAVNICHAEDISGSVSSKLEGKPEFSDKEAARLKKLLKKYPNDPDILIKLAKIKDKVGNTVEAVQLLQLARNIGPDYEDVYLLEAIMLSKLNNKYACIQKKRLRKDYMRVKKKNNSAKIIQYLDTINLGYFNSEIGTGYDKLSNNRGHWTSHYLLAKYVDCSNNSYYGGYEKVKRYEINDEEYHIGFAIPLNKFSYALEYRTSSQYGLLPKQTYYGLMRYGLGSSAGIQFIYTYRDYIEIESRSAGIGVDYYFSDYQLVLSREWVHTNSDSKEFDAATVDKVGFTYYMAKYKYIGLNLSRGTELNYDQSDNPPFGKTETIVLKGLYPFNHNWSVSYEIKRHHQRGYFNQSGGRLGVRYRY